jgi:hypothetical protein
MTPDIHVEAVYPEDPVPPGKRLHVQAWAGFMTGMQWNETHQARRIRGR